MAEYNLSEFRKNTRKAFDEAERGEPVYIERYGEDFILMSKKNWQATVNVSEQIRSDKTSAMLRNKVVPAAKKINSDPQADELPGIDTL